MKVLFLTTVDTLFVRIKRIDQSMDQPSPGDTPSPSAGRERQESVSLHTVTKEDVIGPCRKRRHLTPTGQSPPRASRHSGIAAAIDTLVEIKRIDHSLVTAFSWRHAREDAIG